jgi:ABC-type molybdate transport system substrate-binding protein
MKQAGKGLLFGLLALVLAVPAHGQTQAELRDMPSLTVLVPPAISTPMAELARAYSSKSGVAVVLVVESPGTQVEAIKDGDEADVMIVDDHSWFRELTNLGLLDIYNVRPLFDDPLVVIAPERLSRQGEVGNVAVQAGDTRGFTSASGLTGGSALTSWSEEAAKRPVDDALRLAGDVRRQHVMRDNIQTRNWLLQRPISLVARSTNRLSDATSACLEALYIPYNISEKGVSLYDTPLSLLRALLEPGTGQVALVTAGNYHEYRQARMLGGYHMLPLNPELCHPLHYEAAVVAGQNMALARALLDFLGSGEAKTIMRTYGLKP